MQTQLLRTQHKMREPLNARNVDIIDNNTIIVLGEMLTMQKENLLGLDARTSSSLKIAVYNNVSRDMLSLRNVSRK